MARPRFDSIKTYEEFKKYKWNREELRQICMDRGLLFVGSEKKLNKVIEAYFNGVKIPPQRNWYTNIVLSRFVNENGVMMNINLVMLIISLFLCVFGIVNEARGADEVGYTLPLVFGATFLFVTILSIYWDMDIAVLRSYGPRCGDTKFTREQVDEQANSEKTERLWYGNVLLAPDMLIGVSAGITAVAYEDIASLQVKKRWHTERKGPRGSRNYKDYYTYKIIAKTNYGRRVPLSWSRQDPGTIVKTLHEHCLKHNPNVQLIEKKGDDVKQIVEGPGVKGCVKRALEKQSLIPVTVSEELKNEFIRVHRRKALVLIPESLIVAAVAAVILGISIYVKLYVGGLIFWLAGLAFPFYAIYDFVQVLRSIRKDDIEFYSCEIAAKGEKGYFIKGVDIYWFGYIKDMKPDIEPNAGDRVIMARFRDGYSLVSADNIVPKE